eukprot:52689_1
MRNRQRSRSRSRSPGRYHNTKHRHTHRDNRDRDRNRDRNDQETRNKARNKLIAARSNSVFRSMVNQQKPQKLLSSNPNHNEPLANARTKPKFLSRKEREQLALQKLAEKRVNEREKQKRDKKEREMFFEESQKKKNQRMMMMKDNNHNNNNNNRNRKHNNRNRNKRNNRNNNNNRSNKMERQEERRREQKREELQLIKDEYLGKKRRKKQIVPPSQKFKFNFDWEISEDTSEDLNELYTRRARVSFLFGRGYIAGIDRDEQNKKNAAIWGGIKKGKQKMRKEEALDDDDEMAAKLRLRRLERERKDRLRCEREILDARNWRDKSLSEMSERDWRILKEEFRISSKFGGRLPKPIRFWSESGLPASILDAIRDVAGYAEPYKIQRMAIPVGLSNRDCVGIAETGSGKTAAFVVPMLVYVLKQPPMNNLNFEDGPYALVLAPTRELAKQIENETNKFASFIKISAITIVGGISHDEQSNLLRNGVEVIIATPGRLLDCIDRRILVLNQCNYVVLDEADRMIDMGFEPQVNAIFDKMPSTNLRPIDDDENENENCQYRQTFMFSATMPPAVERLTRKYLRNPVYITIGDPNATAAEHVKQNVIWIQEKNKRKHLQKLLSNGMEPPIMVFVNMKKNADHLAKYLRGQSFNAISLHGGKSQENREYALEQFKLKEYDILVCTSVAARGIDIENVQHVINYDMPNDIRDYCHRIGRTGRAGQQGVATSFLTKDDSTVMFHLKKMLLKTGNKCPPELMHNEAALRNPNLPFEPKTTKQILAKVKPV